MIQQLELTDYVPPPRSRRGEPVAAFVLAGDPHPWTRPRVLILPNGRQTEGFQGPYGKWRKRAIADLSAWWMARGNLKPIAVPLLVRIVAVYARPRKAPTVTIAGDEVLYPWPWSSDRRPSLAVGDVDNVAKAVLDVAQHPHKVKGLEVRGPMLADDRWVVELEAVKVYAAVGEEPRTEVRMWRAA